MKITYTSNWAKELLEKVTITQEKYDLKSIILSDWFDHNPTTAEIFERMEKEGLDYCPPDAFNQIAETMKNGDWITLGMKPILDRDGDPVVFSLYSVGDGLKLNGYIASPDIGWNAGRGFVFCLRKSSDPLTLSPSLESAIAEVKKAGYVIYKPI